MTKFEIYQYSEDIFVFRGAEQFMIVKRTVTWQGKLISYFWLVDKMILGSTLDVFFARTRIAITYQDLSRKVVLRKSKRQFYLEGDDFSLSSRWRPFRNPCFEIRNHDEAVGSVLMPSFQLGTPVRYSLTTSSNDDLDLYILLRFLLEMEQTM
jgi:hypothetical protein